MVSNYFSSGNVYVIDDVFEEAKPIIDSLYNFQIPHIYSDGSGSSLPKSPVQVRLIFLDLNLKPTVNPNDKKSFMDMHANILNQLLDNTSSSYIILVWSKEEETLLPDFKEMLQDEKFNLLHRLPLDIIELKKNDYFSQSIIEGDDHTITWTWIPEKESQLFTKIEETLNKNEPFKILSSWETLIRKSGSKTLDYLFELASFKKGEDLNTNLRKIISKLSISTLGAKNYKESDDQGRTDGFMLALSELIDDEIDREIILNTQKPEFTSWVKPEVSLEFICQLNNKLLVSNDIRKKELTGSLFHETDEKHDYKNLFFESIDISKEGKALKELIEFNDGKAKGEKIDILNYVKNSMGVYENIIPIELNLTPLCDVIQKKEKYYRLVPGFLLNVRDAEYLWKSSDRNYVSPPIFIEHFKNNYVIVLDYRYFHSISFEELNKLYKIASLRKKFVDDIQLKLSNHVSRLGVLNL